jgi:hypothetical protein
MLTSLEVPIFEDRIATNIIVPGRGLVGNPEEPDTLGLTEGAMQRVDRLFKYVTHPDHIDAFRSIGGAIVFSGSHPGDRMPVAPPPEFREGALMLENARYKDWPEGLLAPPKVAGEPEDTIPAGMGRLRLHSEVEADTTLENMLRTRERGFFGTTNFTPENPVGLVMHGERDKKGRLTGHAARGVFFAAKALKIDYDCIEPILVEEEDSYAAAMSEGTLLAISRIAFAGASSKIALRFRESALNGLNQKLRGGAHELQPAQSPAA